MSAASPRSDSSLPDPLAVLSAQGKVLWEKAQRAFEQGAFGYVLSACEAVLAVHPELVAVRRLHYAALKRKFPRSEGFMGKFHAAVSGAMGGVSFARGSRPREQLTRAEMRLRAKPYDVAALRGLGEAATELGWHETAIFAHEAIRDLQPDSRPNLLALGAALLDAAGPACAAEALKIADALLAQNPVDGDAQTLMRRAAIAQTVDKGNWLETGDFRTKLREG